MSPSARGFASDNSAGVHPSVLEAIARANTGHAFGYGHDPLTHRVEQLLKDEFGADAVPYLVWGGTAANVLALRAVCRPWEAAICADTAHMNVDEAGAPEAIAGVKLLLAHGEHGKLTPELVEPLIARIGDEHAVQPRILSVSQSTELGTVYEPQELAALAELAHAHELLLHVDGARLTNAAAALGTSLRAVTSDVNADVISFGGTKTGLLGAEAIVFLRPELADGFAYLRKQSLQLASKMRFLAAQFEALLADELWRELAANANAMAARLAEAVATVPGAEVTRPVQANAVFVKLPRRAITELLEQFSFYVWDERADEVRWMCSWDTTESDVRRLTDALRAALRGG